MDSRQQLINDVRRYLAELDKKTAKLEDFIARLRAVEVVKSEDGCHLVETASGLVSSIQDALDTLGISTPVTREALEPTLDAMEKTLRDFDACRARLSLLADALDAASASHVSPRIAKILNEERIAASQEVRTAASSMVPPLLPGTKDGAAWLAWARELDTEVLVEQLRAVENELPKLVDFLLRLGPGQLELSGPISSASPVVGEVIESSVVPDVEHLPDAGDESQAEAGESRLVVDVKNDEQPHQLEPEVGAISQSLCSPEKVAPLETMKNDSGKLSRETSEVEVPAVATRLKDFEQYHWVNRDGVFEAAPWTDPDVFGKKLTQGFISSLNLESLGRAHVFAKALQQLNLESMISESHITEISELLRGSPDPNMDPSRLLQLSQAAEGEWGGSQAALRIECVIQAIVPSFGSNLSQDQISNLVDFAHFSNGSLGQVVRGLLERGRYESSPLDRLRDQLNAVPTRPPTEVGEQLEKHRQHLNDIVRGQWSACGGRVERTHCRKAWSCLMEEAKPFFEKLYPGAKSDDWNLDELQRKLRTLEKNAVRIFDNAGAKMKDRRTMDHAAEEILGAARTVLHVASDLQQKSAECIAQSENRYTTQTIEAARRLRTEKCLIQDEELARMLFVKLLESLGTTRAGTLALYLVDVALWPGLLELADGLDSTLLKEENLKETIFINTAALRQTLRAAAILLEPPRPIPQTGVSLSEALRTTLANRRDLAALVGLQQPPNDPLFPRIELEAFLEKAHVRLGKLRTLVRDLDALALGEKLNLFECVRDAEQALLIETQAASRSIILFSWLDDVIAKAETALEFAIKTMLRQLETLTPELASQVVAFVERGKLADAQMLVSERRISSEVLVRETVWRKQAMELAPEPVRALKEWSKNQTEKGAVDLVQAWVEGLSENKPMINRGLRTKFAEFILSERGAVTGDSQEHVIETKWLRDWFARGQLNPTFLPQLASAEKIVLLTPPKPPSNSRFVRLTANAVAQYQGQLVIVLVPKLGMTARNELIEEFWARGLRAGVLDDLDLWRLVRPDGGHRPNGPIALLELMLEQQRWSLVSPFQGGEGQHVQMEMFVGRKTEAEELARTKEYSQIFSGRKLGKSALLRFIEHTYSNYRLPSGNHLRVVYVSVVGTHEDDVLVMKIEDTLATKLGYQPVDLIRESSPKLQLEKVIRGYLDSHPEESLLFVLDEADVFFEAQLSIYERDENEESISFYMRSAIESIKDLSGLPRVRFVFAGYRATNKREGAWANWGKVLFLEPLTGVDATMLVEGPLARLGIDASVVAPVVAWRCGYQPAVIHRFCRQLLERLDARRVGPRNDLVVLNDDDVTETFMNPSVQEEIRTVVRNNFQGHREAGVVFAALLQEINELPVGDALEDAPQLIVKRLINLGGDLSWLRANESSAPEEVLSFLSQFTDRALLVDDRTQGVSRFRLRFPHHMSSLRTLLNESYIRNEITSLRTLRPQRSRVPRSLVPLRTVQQISWALQGPAKDSVRAAVVVGLWPDALMEIQGGLAARLGMPLTSRYSPESALANAAAKKMFIGSVSARFADELLNQRSLDLPPPVLCGGIDLLRWGLKKESEPDYLWEIGAVGRLSRSALNWWFTRVRGFEFDSSDTLDVILAATGGLSPLVGVVDSGLLRAHGAGGETLSRECNDEVLALVEGHLDQLAKDLANGPSTYRLLPRERELLEMAVRATRAFGPTSLREALMNYSELLEEPNINSATDSDRDALAVLVMTGLLPIDPEQPSLWPLERLGVLNSGDPIYKIVDRMPPSKD